MAEFDRQYQTVDRSSTVSRAGARAGIDEGLRAFMLGIYNNMAMGLAVTGVAAFATFYFAVEQTAGGAMLTPFGQAVYASPLKWVIMFAPLLFVFGFSAGINRMQPGTARMVFLAFAAVMGLSLSTIFLVFTGQSIVQTFFVTAAAFGGLSLWGYTTKKDLSGWGSFLVMGLIGIIIASIVNIFLASSALQFAVSAIGVLLFAGLTAYDTQRLKNTYDYVSGDTVAAGRASIMGALQLYLDFINLFMFLLQFMGNRN
ncbi:MULTISPECIES: Bax inhibitor-1/YccA family protein [unclassified Afifella]|uniref:Bax inhibitor-1/YccA family protein n=1 Tax=unclassified Afifella TaxID=2624128 RepID=UPI001F17E8E8|nr:MULTISPECIES: Bax inhibitor-1/YccA family protein [unclassified Afifella]MCF1505361.1 Bax inhibitor-1/YccA family protein [Afifella sp. H1R]MCT8268489.1 Bax inhibitor-1/YccA family protein [Afifella sp. JA880]